MPEYSSGKGTTFFYLDMYIYSSGCELSTSWLQPPLLWFSRLFVRLSVMLTRYNCFNKPCHMEPCWSCVSFPEASSGSENRIYIYSLRSVGFKYGFSCNTSTHAPSTHIFLIPVSSFAYSFTIFSSSFNQPEILSTLLISKSMTLTPLFALSAG